MVGMKHASNPRRGRSRGGNGGKRHQPSRNQAHDSNGPEGKVRGSAQQVYDKYLSLARDATSAGEHIAAEGYYQFAEHYYRVANVDGANNQAQNRSQQGNQNSDDQSQNDQSGDNVDQSNDAQSEDRDQQNVAAADDAKPDENSRRRRSPRKVSTGSDSNSDTTATVREDIGNTAGASSDADKVNESKSVDDENDDKDDKNDLAASA